ncbi:MAG: carboxypeptidase regulatory-like domain-containing protein [Acidobacteria bacterium]|nr:carboxypeptidase regulatory-like domain-containing protein [Acidobacteriota bacterium]
MNRAILLTSLLFALSVPYRAQTVNSEIFGTVKDSSSALVTGAVVRVTNTETGIVNEDKTDSQGRYRFPLLRPGNYQVGVEREGFRKHVEGPFELRLNQSAEVNVKLEVGAVSETVNVTSESPIINTTNAEVSTTFETKRISEVPLAPNRNILNLALNVAGVSQLSSGQSGFASGINMAVNGMRVRSNNFMIDGQDTNDPSVTGATQGINNTDVVAEFRVITNQFAAEYGRAAGSVINIITKSGTNNLHGSLFWYNNNNGLNTRSNQDKRRPVDAGRTPFRNENQFGGTAGGRIIKNKTFYFGSYQRWWDRRLGTGTVIDGPPTEAGRALLQPFAGTRPALKALLDYLPAGVTTPGLQSERVVIGGQTLTIPYGRLGGAANRAFDDKQASVKIDHRLTDKHSIGGRYLYQDNADAGGGQVTPPGLTTLVPVRNQLGSIYWNASFTPHIYSEFRANYTRQSQETTAQDLKSQAIPSIEVNSVGLTGFNAAASRTGIGLAVNLPQFRKSNTYQLQQNIGWLKDSHSIKFGYDLRRNNTASFFVPTTRGRLVYNNLQDLVDDVAQSTQINGPIRGGQIMQYYQYYDAFFFLQDEWRVKPNFTLTYGFRYELPGNPFASIKPIADRIVAANGNDQRYAVNFPGRDTNNIQPRIGFNYRFGAAPGMLRFLTGDGKLVLRGGYARTNDFAFLNIALNIFSAFPYVASYSLDPRTPNSYPQLISALSRPITNPNALTRTTVSPDFRSPAANQFSLQLQRQFFNDWSFNIGWIGTRGLGLFQTIDGNPVRSARVSAVAASGAYSFALDSRVDPTYGVIRTRANTAGSLYHALQMSAEKRFSRNLAFGAHYTWSSFIDDASEIFNPAVNGDVAVSQDSFNRRIDRARSTYDRPHRLSTTHTYELPFKGKGVVKHLLGGWQLNGYLTFQAGAPFTPLNGTDPFLRLSGIDGLVGNAVRPNLNPGISLAGRNIGDLYSVRTTLFSPIAANAASAGSTLAVSNIIPVQGKGLGNIGRNTLRADGIGNYDFGILKKFSVSESNTLQLRADFFNVTNTRNFGIPESRVNSGNFLNQWGQDGGNRRIQVGFRYTF